MQHQTQQPVGQEVSQDALRGGGAAPPVGQQGADGVVERVRAAAPQLHVGHRRLPPMKQRLVEEQQVSADPEGHRR